MNNLTFLIIYGISIIVTFVVMLYFEIYFEKNSEEILYDEKNLWEAVGIKTFKDVRTRMEWLFIIPCCFCIVPVFNVLCMFCYVIKWLLKKIKVANWIDNIKV